MKTNDLKQLQATNSTLTFEKEQLTNIRMKEADKKNNLFFIINKI